MKKYFIFFAIILQSTLVFGQTSEWSEWGAWTNCNCYSKLMFRLKSASSPKYNESNFLIEFKSNYSQNVSFGWDGFNNQNEANIYFSKGSHGTQSDISLSPGKSTTSSFSNKGAGSKIAYIVVYRLSIGKDNQHYQKCDNQIPCSYCEVNKDPYCPNYVSSNQNNNSNNNQNIPQTIRSSGSSVQTNKTQPNYTTQSQSNQVINSIPNNTNTEILNVLETTTNQVTNSITNSIQKSVVMSKENNLEVKNIQEEFANNNLSDKEIDSLLANPDPNNYATINVYNSIKQNVKWYVMINGKKLPVMDKKNNYSVYRIYTGNKLVVQTYPIGIMGSTLPIQSITTRIRKGKNYHFLIKKEGMMNFLLEQIEEEPLDKKRNKIYENINQKIKSDIDY